MAECAIDELFLTSKGKKLLRLYEVGVVEGGKRSRKTRIGTFQDWIDAEDFIEDIEKMTKCSPRMKELKDGCVVEIE